jgi:hypothetical protein
VRGGGGRVEGGWEVISNVLSAINQFSIGKWRDICLGLSVVVVVLVIATSAFKSSFGPWRGLGKQMQGCWTSDHGQQGSGPAPPGIQSSQPSYTNHTWPMIPSCSTETAGPWRGDDMCTRTFNQ